MPMSKRWPTEKLLQLGIVLEILVIVMQVVVYAEHPYPAKVI